MDQKGFGAAGWVMTAAAVILVVFGGWYVWQKNETKSPPTRQVDNSDQRNNERQEIKFSNPKKGAHFETSTPAHGTTLAAPPAGVVINFNFDLADISSIRIMSDGKDYGKGSTAVDTDKLALRRSMDKNAPDGLYTVAYNGCWPDRTCHDGSFQFAIDRSLLKSYEDKRGGAALTIRMSQIQFRPMNLRISSGTKITWINDDAEVHYINTDSHPAHSHTPGLNSRALVKGQSYSFTFNGVGVYPYHCSAHAAQMTGVIVVEDS